MSNSIYFLILLDGAWQQVELNGQIKGTLLEHLKPATQYTLRVLAEGPAGRSSPSQELAVQTQPQRPSGPPLNVAARPVSPTQLLVTWAPPLQELRHGEILGFNVGVKEIRYFLVKILFIILGFVTCCCINEFFKHVFKVKYFHQISGKVSIKS